MTRGRARLNGAFLFNLAGEASFQEFITNKCLSPETRTQKRASAFDAIDGERLALGPGHDLQPRRHLPGAEGVPQARRTLVIAHPGEAARPAGDEIVGADARQD